MSRQHRRALVRQHRGAGIAVASACEACAHLIGDPELSGHGLRMGIIHRGHVAGLQALGWILTADPDGGPPDCACIHYHLKHWEGGHGDDCCGLGGST